jgi:hypothetical protein
VASRRPYRLPLAASIRASTSPGGGCSRVRRSYLRHLYSGARTKITEQRCRRRGPDRLRLERTDHPTHGFPNAERALGMLEIREFGRYVRRVGSIFTFPGWV